VKLRNFYRRYPTTIAEQAMDLLVNIDVDDLLKAITFYQEATGLRLGRRFGPSAWKCWAPHPPSTCS
jgi:hypothetical protein